MYWFSTGIPRNTWVPLKSVMVPPNYIFTGTLSKIHIWQVMGNFYLFIADFFATQIIGGTKELVVLVWLSCDILYKRLMN